MLRVEFTPHSDFARFHPGGRRSKCRGGSQRRYGEDGQLAEGDGHRNEGVHVVIRPRLESGRCATASSIEHARFGRGQKLAHCISKLEAGQMGE